MRFSICVPNYNYGRYLGETIGSVLSQDEPDLGEPIEPGNEIAGQAVLFAGVREDDGPSRGGPLGSDRSGLTSRPPMAHTCAQVARMLSCRSTMAGGSSCSFTHCRKRVLSPSLSMSRPFSLKRPPGTM